MKKLPPKDNSNPEIRAEVLEEVIRRSNEAKGDYLTHAKVAKKIRG